MRLTSTRVFRPRLPAAALNRVLALARLTTDATDSHSRLVAAADAAENLGGSAGIEEAAILRVLADLLSLGWHFRNVRSTLYLIPRQPQRNDRVEEKTFLRKSLLKSRDAQLREPSTQLFLESIHSRRVGKTDALGLLIDDGQRLADDLRAARGGDLSQVIRPYLEFVEPQIRCSHTGLLLTDIWRYFRHTWSLTFRSTPGRNINYLIRNGARPGHPVMGIVGLANAVFQLTTRDEWIGWTEPSLVARLTEHPSAWATFLRTARTTIMSAARSIRSEDLVQSNGTRGSLLDKGKKLERIAKSEHELRNRDLRESHVNEDVTPSVRHMVKKGGEIDWRLASETPLFRRKRAETLADIYFALHHLNNAAAGNTERAPEAVIVKRGDRPEVVWADPALGRAVRIALREIKKNGVSGRILDVNVCGAAPTYRQILGGKLAAMSLFSAEVQEEYVRRYSGTPSHIASCMAGRPIRKKAHLCVLTTTSLYAVGSSQYNRVRVSANGRTLEWNRIGETEGFGSVQFAKQTIDAVRRVSIGRRGMRNVNNLFGEGTSPLMRQMREGLELLGFEPNDVLEHANKRLVYAAELYHGARADLLADSDSYSRGPAFRNIADQWQRRWLAMRICNETVLDAIQQVSAEAVKKELTSEGQPA